MARVSRPTAACRSGRLRVVSSRFASIGGEGFASHAQTDSAVDTYGLVPYPYLLRHTEL